MSRQRVRLLLGGWCYAAFLQWWGCAAPAPTPPPAPPAVATAAPGVPVAATAPAISCRPDVAEPAAPGPGTAAHCVIDAGSRNLKLVVAAVKGTDVRSLTTLRQCRARMQLADRTRDPRSGEPRPLSAEDQGKVLAVFAEYQRLCQQSGGRMHGAVATEWARSVPNIEAVKRRFAEEAALPLRVLSRQEEARAAYLSATRGERGKLVLDFGSRSMQLAFWAKDAAEPDALSVPLGIDEAGDRFLAAGADPERGRQAVVDAWKGALGDLVARAREAQRRGALARELYSLGENGDLALAVAGKLWPGTPPRAVDEAGYAAALKSLRPAGSPPPSAFEITSGKLRALGAIYVANPPLLDELRAPALKRVFGNKMLVYPVLVGWLEDELGLEKVVLLPQEMTEGVLVAALGAARPVTRK